MALNEWENDSEPNKSRSLATIPNPSQAIFLFEAKLQNATYKTPQSGIQRDQWLGAFAAPGADSEVTFWHGGGGRTNVAFGDGSVRGLSSSELTARFPASDSMRAFRAAAGL